MRLKVRFVGAMLERGYSGGRLLALSMANSLVGSGIDVDFVTNVMPQMAAEFRRGLTIRIGDFRDLSSLADQSIDVAVIVPGLGHFDHHGEFLRHALECRARIVLLNFETPNWFNAVSPISRDESLWDGWRLIAGYADMVLSISAEGDRWARAYYADVRPDCIFDYCYTAINSDIADQSENPGERQRRILMLTRVDGHKGHGVLEPLLDRAFEGFEVLMCLGSGELEDGFLEEWRGRFAANGLAFEVRGPAIGLEKFRLIRSAAVLYFPTRFEGFGIPPLEAGYCGTPVACADLPVLREFGKDAFYYADPSDVPAMRQALIAAIASGEIGQAQRDRLRGIASMGACGERLATQMVRLGPASAAQE